MKGSEGTKKATSFEVALQGSTTNGLLQHRSAENSIRPPNCRDTRG
ncbi:hypothetical protein SAMN02745166_01251 [Prosthecobacter debontii]|uniref:Uncharacterized protein n=1 Tax=Prosthecobacter debontii TaxID=48467 RepID=A0A1T4XAI5_9BACT|nr:hypothetical protein SAMN02745166_01251 [Prosthecobacter debontii]